MKHSKKQPSSDRAFETGKRTFAALALMHDGLSLPKAAREAGTTTTTVLKHRPAALHKSKTGRWMVNKNDPYVRHVRIYGPLGVLTVRARGYKEAQLASNYLIAVARWRRSGKASELAPFHGKKIGGVELLTSMHALEALRDAGLLDQLDSLYASLKETV